MPIRIQLLRLSAIAAVTLSAQAATAVPSIATEVNPVEIGSTAPDATIYDIHGKSIQLSDLLDSQATVLVFYRGGWCPYCTRQLAALGEIEEDIIAADYKIIALSPDRPEVIAEMSTDDDASYSLYSDSSMEAAQAFGLAFQVDASTLERYDKHGIDLEASSGKSHHWLPVPAVYVIEKGGQIRFRHYDPNYRERLSSAAILEAIRNTPDVITH